MSLFLRSNKDLFEQLSHNQDIFLHPGQRPSPQLPALCKTSFVLSECRTLLGCCSRGASAYRCSSPCLLPRAWLRICSQESRLQVVLGGGTALILPCLHPGFWSISAMRRGGERLRSYLDSSVRSGLVANLMLAIKDSEMHPFGVRPGNELAGGASEAEQSSTVEYCCFLWVFYFALCSLYGIAEERFIFHHSDLF